MGTSSIYRGPKGNQNSIDGCENINITGKEWKRVKNAFSRLINMHSKGKSISVGGVIEKYKRARGGTSSWISSSHRAVRTASALYGFISSIQEIGYENTLVSLKINIIGLSVEQGMVVIMDALIDEYSSKDDVVIRNAMAKALSELYKEVEDQDIDLNKLDSIDNRMKNKILKVYITEYIFASIMKDLFSRFEQKQTPNSEIISLEQEYRNYIKSKVDVEIDNMTIEDTDTKESLEQKIENIYADIIDILGEDK